MIKLLALLLACSMLYLITPWLMGLDGLQLLGGLVLVGLSAQAIRLVFSLLNAMTTFRR